MGAAMGRRRVRAGAAPERRQRARLFGDQHPDSLGRGRAARLSRAALADLPSGTGGGRQRAQGREGHDDLLCRALHPERRRGRGDDRGCDPVRARRQGGRERRRRGRGGRRRVGALPQALHRLQCRAMRRLAGPLHGRRPALAAARNGAGCRGADRGERRRRADRRQRGLLFADRRLCRAAAAAGVRRADRLLSHRAARTGALDGAPFAAGSRPVGRLRERRLWPRGTVRRTRQRLPVRGARHQARRAPRRLHRRVAGDHARRHAGDLPRREPREQGGGLSARLRARCRVRGATPGAGGGR